MLFAIIDQLTHNIRMNDLDDTDIRLLRTLQQNAQFTSEKLGEALNLSPSQTGRRRQRLEKEGYVEGYRAKLSARRLGLSVQAFVTVQMATHAPDKVRTFTRIVDTRPEIVSAWTMTGEADYLLRVYCRDLAALHVLLHEVLLPNPAVARVQSQIVMDQFKVDGPLPI